jgi:hypothetical protein
VPPQPSRLFHAAPLKWHPPPAERRALTVISGHGTLAGWIIFESHNPGCEFTQKHYNSGNMQKLQKEWTGKGIVWLTLCLRACPPIAR